MSGGWIGGASDKFRNGYFPVNAKTSFFGNFGELCAQSSVQEGNPTTDLAAQGVKQGVVVAARCAVEGFVGTLGWDVECVPEAYSAARLELPVVKVKPSLFSGSTPAESIANASTGEEPGLIGGRELKPKFLRVDFVDGVGEPALKGADLPK